MAHMINRPTLFVVILLAPMLLYGCSGLSEDPRNQANEAISAANESVARHNELFEETRSTYEAVKEEIESSGGTGDEENAFQEEREQIAAAADNLRQARSELEEARGSLGEVDDLEVDPTVKEYASLLSGAMEAQISAESSEIEFYELLQEDPTLEDNREAAERLLSEAGDGYQEAENAYQEAQELADANPDLLGPAPTGETGEETGG
jgi:uncharacterized coiled-coil DUF342 family protein